MQITVKIDCDTIDEFDGHLGVLRKQIKSKAKKEKLNPLRDEFKKGKGLFYDDNCYGTHFVNIKEDKL